MQQTALRARKIGAFLKVGIGLDVIPIYGCAAADAQTVSRQSITRISILGAVMLYCTIILLHTVIISTGKHR